MPARHVTDGGLETDLIFLRGIDLPAFASLPLLDSEDGRAVLRDYYLAYADIAVRAGAPCCSRRRRGGRTPTTPPPSGTTPRTSTA